MTRDDKIFLGSNLASFGLALFLLILLMGLGGCMPKPQDAIDHELSKRKQLARVYAGYHDYQAFVEANHE